MKTPTKIHKLNLKKFLLFIDQKNVAVPEFQRNYVWKVAQIKNLFDSLVKQFPIGSFIIWRTGKNIEARTINGNKLGKEKYLILDGQQRMTTLFYLCEQAKFRQNAVKDRFAENCEARHRSVIDFDNFFFKKNGKIFELDYIKRGVNNDGFDLRKFEKLLGNYRFPVIVVSIEDYQKAREIFERINQAGTKISTESIFLSEIWNKHCNFGKLLRTWKSGKKAEALSRDIDTVIFIHAFSIVYQLEKLKKNTAQINVSIKTLKKIAEEIRLSEKSSHQNKFGQVLDSVSHAMEFLKKEYGITKISDLPSQTMLTILSVFFYYKNHPTANQKNELKKWFWRSSLGNRYIGSGYNENIGPDSRSMRDLALLGKKLNLPKALPSLADFEKVELDTGRSTMRNAVKQLLWLQRPVWIDGDFIDRQDIETGTKQKEDDHFYPRNWMRKGYVGSEINNILNIQFIPKTENAEKSDHIPSEWLAEKIEHFEASDNSIKKYFKGNLLPFENLNDLKRFEKAFIRKKGRIWPNIFRKKYKSFLQKRYNIFRKEFDKLQN